VMAGLLVAGLVVMAEAQQAGRRGGFGTGPAQLIVNETVQKDLKLTDDQTEKVKAWSKEYTAKQAENRKTGGGKNSTPEERAERTAESHKAVYKELAGVLKSEQIDRLKQIERQASGVQAFQDAETVAALKLTDDQKTKLKAALDEYTKETADLRGGGGRGKGGKGGFDKEKMAENTKKREEASKTALTAITATLTDDQKKTWKDLTGESFDTTKLTPGGGFGGGRNKTKAKDE